MRDQMKEPLTRQQWLEEVRDIAKAAMFDEMREALRSMTNYVESDYRNNSGLDLTGGELTKAQAVLAKADALKDLPNLDVKWKREEK